MIRCKTCGDGFERYAEQLNLFDETTIHCCPTCATNVEEGEFEDAS